MSQKKQRVFLSLEEKLWIIQHFEENPGLSRVKISKNFAKQFGREITRQCVQSIIAKRSALMATIQAWVRYKKSLEVSQILDI